MNSTDELDSWTAQRLLMAWKAMRSGKLKFPPELQHCADELLAASLTAIGLVDTRGMSRQTIMIAKTFGSALSIQEESAPEPPKDSVPSSMAGLQTELFGLFSNLFAAVTGRTHGLINDENEIKERMIWRVKHETDSFEKSVKFATEELREFYSHHSINMFKHAKCFGGMRLVSGGQRLFGPSALNGIRVTGLYADTQLIPDPVFPFLHSDLSLNAAPLQLAIQLFHLLQLRPLVDAELPVPPVFIFPSFEEHLEQEDAHTKLGIERLAIRLVAPLCEGQISSLDDLFDYSIKHEAQFLQSLMPSGLFVPPGRKPGIELTAEAAAKQYIADQEGRRSSTLLEQMKRLPLGLLLLNGVLERLRPHYHLLENASELGAQPLLTQPVHWHYFEKISTATARDLRSKELLSEQAFQTLRAIQDESLSWLANIPVTKLAELLSNSEHRWFREELNKYTSQLASIGTIDTSTMVREVNHGLASLVQRQQKSLTDIERKYAPKKTAAYAAGIAGAGLAATALLLPSLSPLLGVSVPIVTLAGAAGGALMGYGKERLGEAVEKSHSEKSMLGILATTRPHQ